MNYIAQANIIFENIEVKKGRLITEKLYNSLPDSLKLKFVQGSVASKPLGLNEIIGDTAKEKAKREQLVKQGKKSKR